MLGEFTPAPKRCSAADHNSTEEKKMLHEGLLPYTTLPRSLSKRQRFKQTSSLRLVL